MRENQAKITEWIDSVAPPTNGREAGIRAQAIKLVHESIETALACGVSGSDIFEEVNDLLDQVSEHQMLKGDPTLDKAPVEVADVVIVANALAGRLGCDLESEVDAKMAKNRARTWKVDADGKAQHVGGTGA